MKPETYPCVAQNIMFIAPDELLRATEAVIKLTRDHGDRTNRKHARLKYVVAEKGLEWTKLTLAEYFGKDRPISVSRELTKLYEETVRGTVAEVLTHFTKKAPKGEFVVVVGGKK